MTLTTSTTSTRKGTMRTRSTIVREIYRFAAHLRPSGTGRELGGERASWGSRTAIVSKQMRPVSGVRCIPALFPIVLQALTVLGGSATTASAQCDPQWVLVATAGPSPRNNFAMAYDSVRERIVLFGGNTGGDNGETWEWDGVAWTRVALTGPQPGPRRGARMAFDAARGECVMVGSESGEPNVRTWLWNGLLWRSVDDNPNGNRSSAALAYDPIRQRVMVHGGSLWIRNISEWDGFAWASRSDATPPAGRQEHTAAFLPSRGTVVIFGGYASPGEIVNEMWDWNGSEWSPVPQASPPPHRNNHAMAYDAARSRLVVVGGGTSTVCGLADTWEFDGTTWQQMNSGAGFPGMASGSAAYDEARQQVVLFGGFAGGCASRSGETHVWTAKPALTRRPNAVSTCPGGTSTFSITAAGSTPFTYQWRKGTVPMDSTANPSAATATLTLADVQPSDADSYDCIITNACGSVTSDPATLTICACLDCPADFNQDGGIDGSDVAAFFGQWENGHCDADVNADGGVDGADVDSFFAAWEAGGCG